MHHWLWTQMKQEEEVSTYGVTVERCSYCGCRPPHTHKLLHLPQ